MKISTLMLYVLWPAAVVLVLWALITCGVAWHAWIDRNAPQRKLRADFDLYLHGKTTYFPWRSRLAYAVAASVALAYFQGWLVLA